MQKKLSFFGMYFVMPVILVTLDKTSPTFNIDLCSVNFEATKRLYSGCNDIKKLLLNTIGTNEYKNYLLSECNILFLIRPNLKDY